MGTRNLNSIGNTNEYTFLFRGFISSDLPQEKKLYNQVQILKSCN